MLLIDAMPCGERVLLELECVESAGSIVYMMLHAGAFRARLDLTTAEAHELARRLQNL